MENKAVGYIVMGISVIIVGIIFLFRSALKSIVSANCSLAHGGNSCPMYVTINQQTYLALAIVGVLVIFGAVLIFTKPDTHIIVKKVKEKKEVKKVDLTGFRPEDKQVYELVKSEGTVFQASIMEKTGFVKAKVSRIIDRLEGKGLVERKRRGMTNVIVLKEE